MGAGTTTERQARPSRRTGRRRAAVWRFVRGLIAVSLAVLYLLILLTYVLPLARGGGSFTVSEGDRPSVIDDGSVAFVRPARGGSIEVGDIVTTAGTGDATWRVLVIDREGTMLVESFDGTDMLLRSDVDGEVWFHLTMLGSLRDALTSPLGLALLLPATLGLLIWDRAARRARPEPGPTARRDRSTRRSRRAAASDGGSVRLQVELVVLAEVDDYELRFALAELGGAILSEMGPSTRLIRLTGTPSALDVAEERLADVGRIDAVRRSDEVSMEIPVTHADDAAA
ncbi:MAG: hypothetical protein AAGA99_10405 [Actinomycetota bacterium]